VQGNIKGISSKLKSRDNEYSKKNAALIKVIENLKVELKRMESDLSILSSSKADKIIVDISLKNERKNFEQKIDQISKKIDTELTSINKKIKGQSNADALSGKKKSSRLPNKLTDSKVEVKSVSKKNTLGKDSIIEEDIQ